MAYATLIFSLSGIEAFLKGQISFKNEILNLIESVSEDFPSYSFTQYMYKVCYEHFDSKHCILFT